MRHHRVIIYIIYIISQNGGELERIRTGGRAVQVLREHGDGLSTDEVAQLLGVSRASAYGQLINAERDGHVSRTSGRVEGSTKPQDSWHLTSVG